MECRAWLFAVAAVLCLGWAGCSGDGESAAGAGAGGDLGGSAQGVEGNCDSEGTCDEKDAGNLPSGDAPESRTDGGSESGTGGAGGVGGSSGAGASGAGTGGSSDAGMGSAGAGSAGTGSAGTGSAGVGSGGAGAGSMAGTGSLPAACGGAACDQPPPSVCVNAGTLQTFGFQGTCNGDSCDYPISEQSCPSGCVAGLCRSAGQQVHPWTGLYRGTFETTTKVDSGPFVVAVEPSGDVDCYMDASPTRYTGTVDASGAFEANGELGGNTLTFTGMLRGIGPDRSGDGTWLIGGLSAGTWTVDEINPWAGHYIGTLSGDASGSLDVTVEDNGAISASASATALTGSVRIDGMLNLTGTLDGKVVTYSGSMSGAYKDRAGSGGWSSLAASGSWTITEG